MGLSVHRGFESLPLRCCGPRRRVIAGIAYIIASAGADPMLNMVVLYAATGGVDCIIEAWLLARRRHHVTALPAQA